jgi:hypothetical protein
VAVDKKVMKVELVITVKFSFGDPASELSRRLSQYGGATDWWMKPHLQTGLNIAER